MIPEEYDHGILIRLREIIDQTLQSSLTGLRKEYPVISAAGVREADGTLTTVKECGEALNDYRSLEYYLLFDYER